MSKFQQAERSRRVKRWLTRLASGSFGLGLAFSTGCSSTPTSASQEVDPLHGVRTPPSTLPQMPAPKAASNVPSAPTPADNVGGVPPIPRDLSATNTATLAGTSWQGPLGRPLAIDDNGRVQPPGQLTSGSKSPGVLAPNPNPKVEQVPDNAPANPTVTPTSSWQTPQANAPFVQTANAAVPSPAELLNKQLQDRGVMNQKLDQVPEGVHLTCYVSRGPNAGLRIYEVTAVDYPAAAQAILQQLASPQ